MNASTSPSLTPLAVGLVGAGTWAERVHAPMLAAGPETRLAGVWARRPDAAAALARRHGVEAAPSFETLLERSEAIAFAVPPDVQARLATIAACAGKALSRYKRALAKCSVTSTRPESRAPATRER